MTAGLKLAGRAKRAVVLVAQGLLLAYSCLMAVIEVSWLADWETSLRYVGSDVACSLSAIDCSWTTVTISFLTGVATIGLALYSLFLRSRRRDYVVVGGFCLAGLHWFVNWLLFTPY